MNQNHQRIGLKQHSDNNGRVNRGDSKHRMNGSRPKGFPKVFCRIFLAAAFLAVLCILVWHDSGSEDRPADQSSYSLSEGETVITNSNGKYADQSPYNLSEEISATLTEWSTTDSRAADVLDHWQSFPEGMLESAVHYPETLDYLVGYLSWDARKQQKIFDLSEELEAAKGGVPLLLQWDSRWGYAEYGSGLIGYTGCGPTCLSMVALSLTGDTSISPLAVAEYAEAAGYYVDGAGTAWALMYEGCKHFGLTARELTLDESVIKSSLTQGDLIICSMGPGDFTYSGHFIVLAGCDGEDFQVRDPNSVSNSSRSWSYEELYPQIKNLWAFSPDES